MLNRGRNAIPQDDLDALERIMGQVRTVAAREVVGAIGERMDHSTFLISGFMYRFLDDHSGERQILGLHLPGDFVDLHTLPLKKLDHSLASLTDCTIAIVPHRAVMALILERPDFSLKLWLSTLLDAALYREWIFRLGRLAGAERLAHFFCETHARLAAVNRASANEFALPISQADLAQICGMTNVHASRVLRELRDANVLTFRRGIVNMIDYPALMRLGEFQPGYLHLDKDFRSDFSAAPPALRQQQRS